jgi:hypothetical protein
MIVHLSNDDALLNCQANRETRLPASDSGALYVFMVRPDSRADAIRQKFHLAPRAKNRDRFSRYVLQKTTMP